MFNHKYSLPFFIFIPLFISFLYTQNNHDVKVEIESKDRIDSISKKYFIKFDSALIISLHQNWRDIEFDFNSVGADKSLYSVAKYKAQSKLLTGITLSYDKFTLTFNTGATNRENSANTSKIFNLQFEIGDLKKVLNIYLRNYVGFEDISTKNHDSLYYSQYGNYRYPTLNFTQLGIQRIFYTGHKKYAYKAPYGINYRQLKTRGSWIWGWNVITTTFNINSDSSMFSHSIRDTFKTYSTFQGMDILQTGLIGGMALNLIIFKKLFVDATFLFAPELQFRQDNFIEKKTGDTKVSFNTLFKMSAGFNGNKFYWYFWGGGTANLYRATDLGIYQYTYSGGATLGIRFTRMKIPKFYRKFKQTKVYRFL
jgi:hypothetical protein